MKSHTVLENFQDKIEVLCKGNGIEAALGKVRSRSMAMRNPNLLSDKFNQNK